MSNDEFFLPMKLCQSSGNLLYLTKAVLLSIKSGRGGAHWDVVATRRWSWSRWSDVAPEKKTTRGRMCAYCDWLLAQFFWRRSFLPLVFQFSYLYFSSATSISVQHFECECLTWYMKREEQQANVTENCVAVNMRCSVHFNAWQGNLLRFTLLINKALFNLLYSHY